MSADTGMLLYWLGLVVASLTFLLSVITLGRAHELHHGYYGIPIALVGGHQMLPALIAFPFAMLVLFALPSWRWRVVWVAVLVGVGFAPPAIGLALGGVLVADDAGQHVLQLYAVKSGRPEPPDTWPIHRLYAWLVHRFPALGV